METVCIVSSFASHKVYALVFEVVTPYLLRSGHFVPVSVLRQAVSIVGSSFLDGFVL